MLHFHHALGHQALPLGGHEDGPKADLFDLHLALTLEGEEADNKFAVSQKKKNRRKKEVCELFSLTW